MIKKSMLGMVVLSICLIGSLMSSPAQVFGSLGGDIVASANQHSQDAQNYMDAINNGNPDSGTLTYTVTVSINNRIISNAVARSGTSSTYVRVFAGSASGSLIQELQYSSTSANTIVYKKTLSGISGMGVLAASTLLAQQAQSSGLWICLYKSGGTILASARGQLVSGTNMSVTFK